MQDEWDHEESNNSLDLIILTYEISSARKQSKLTVKRWLTKVEETHPVWALLFRNKDREFYIVIISTSLSNYKSAYFPPDIQFVPEEVGLDIINSSDIACIISGNFSVIF